MQRSQALDALRGYAILTMILSGAIAYGGILPAWMYHAQVPPPHHSFDPSIPGITWVDLVFPFFLFSMGAAIPLALSNRIERQSPLQVLGHVLWRTALIVFLAIFLENTKPLLLGQEFSQHFRWWIGLASFAGMFAVYSEWRIIKSHAVRVLIRVSGFLLAAFLLSNVKFSDGSGFRLDRSDIILLVLANVAFAGSFWWWLTRDRPLLRLVFLSFLFAVLLGKEETGSWNKLVVEYTPASWLYQFHFMKYLLIVIPGTFAGEWLRGVLSSGISEKEATIPRLYSLVLSLLALLLVPINLFGLFGRFIITNLLLNVTVIGLILWLVRGCTSTNSLSRKLCLAGTYCVILGLLLEAFQGGIKKDHATYAYFFLTSGLAFFSLLVFYLWERFRFVRSLTTFLAAVGQNPLVAYVAPAALIYPLFGLLGVYDGWSALSHSWFEGVIKGVIVVLLVGVGTATLTKLKWFWKT